MGTINWEAVEEAYYALEAFSGNLTDAMYYEQRIVARYHELLDRLKEAGYPEGPLEYIPPGLLGRKPMGGNYGTGETYYSNQRLLEPDELDSRLDSLLASLKSKLERNLWKPTPTTPSSPVTVYFNQKQSQTASGRDTVRGGTVYNISVKQKEELWQVISKAKEAIEKDPPKDAGDLSIDLDIAELELRKGQPDLGKLEHTLRWLEAIAQGMISSALWQAVAPQVTALLHWLPSIPK